MIKKYTLEIITAIVILLFIGGYLFTASTMEGAEFGGSDGVGSAAVAELTGQSEDSFEPLIPQWEPSSGEIESCLFAIQATIGGIIIGLVFGFWIGQNKKNQVI
ncbi:MAG: cobalt transport protein CbiN [Methanospirillaceae archaeon]|nr:cobalt transport protein CbiN [Methanospirillaceae archaeon]